MVSKKGKYRKLCKEAARRGHVIKLSRIDGTQWGLQLLVSPGRSGARWRAAGVLFPSLSELDRHAAHLLRWLRAIEPAEQ